MQVFRLDAVQSSNSAAARRHLQNYLASLSSFRGRALMGPIAMPPTSRTLPPPQPQVLSCAFMPQQCSFMPLAWYHTEGCTPV